MVSEFLIFYSAYDRRMQILLNGQSAVTDTSPLLKFQDEPFAVWAPQILEVLYSIARKEFCLKSVAHKDEIEVMEKLCREFPYCTSFNYDVLDIPGEELETKMKCLGHLMDKYNLCLSEPTKINVLFCDSTVLPLFKESIYQLSIRNKYICVNFAMQEDAVDFSEVDTAFFLCSSLSEVSVQSNVKHNIILLVGRDSRFIGMRDGVWIYQFAIDDFFDTVFKCMLLFPLAETFYDLTTDLLKHLERTNRQAFLEIRELVSIYGTPSFIKKYSVEKGREVRLFTGVCDIDERLQKLSFTFQYPGIVEIKNNNLYGISKGITKVYVSYIGGLKTIAVFTAEVYTVNRIRELHIDLPTLAIGKGDMYKIGFTYVPEDAEDLDEIIWHSTDKDVASVTKSGLVFGNGCGECEIYCFVNEDIWAACDITVKPYLEDIILPNRIREGTLEMSIGETWDLDYSLNPTDCYDGEVSIVSSDYLVVNVIGKTLSAKSCGKAVISIVNESETIRKSFTVEVTKEMKKRSFFTSFVKV